MSETQDLKSEIAKREEAILAFWRENKIFEKTINTPAGKEPKAEFVFYDGPPFATGLPHFGHLLPTSIKDVIPRYKTMQGYRVPRRFGWDCHGLPVENIVEKELDLKIKKDIEEYGIAKFNHFARKIVLRYADAWREIIPRMGRWVDLENDYRTMDTSYIESVWWVFKTLFERGLIYEGYKSMHICPRCETTLANFEVNQGYKDITDLSVVAKFKLVEDETISVLAWTTTPWTLPGNVALAINPDIEYVLVLAEEKYILAKSKLNLLKTDYEILDTFLGQTLIGKKYLPVFDYFSNQTDLKNKENGWQIYGAPFVTDIDGTGIVHIAPAFGEDDMKLGEDNQLPFIQHVSMDGRFKAEVASFAGLEVKPKGDHQASDILVIKYLASRGALFTKEKIKHSYPHCWRCDTPLLNYAATSWFVKVSSLREKLLTNNEQINWTPDHIKTGRFGNWLAGARDWAISRSRFWGAPIPVWRCDKCGHLEVVGSIPELSTKLKKYENRYILMRHGESEHNVQSVLNSDLDQVYHLTAAGRKMVDLTSLKLKEDSINLIITSPFARTQETALLVANQLGYKTSDIVVDERLAEIKFGIFEGKNVGEYHRYFETPLDKFTKVVPQGETLNQVKKRLANLITELEAKYQDKNILIISHEYPLWMFEAVINSWSPEIALEIKGDRGEYINPGEYCELKTNPLPKNDLGEIDLHRPYIDEVKFGCACGGWHTRVLDVFDCWFESGAMPYAQDNYPFKQNSSFKPEMTIGFPADFIAEGLDQTRGWFYSLLVLSTALFDKPAYKNVVVNGLILAEDGQKMSKRLKNYPDINLMIDNYGADALRFYLLSSPAVHADDFSFSEKGLAEVSRKIILRLDNVFSFYTLVPNPKPITEAIKPRLVIDRWILARLTNLGLGVEEALEAYELDRATRLLDSFIDDLSTWYIRRSRDRFKSSDLVLRQEALDITGYVLWQLLRIMAPFTPFITEALYERLDIADQKESVHLESWPTLKWSDESIILEMEAVRLIVESALALRSKTGFKVRQPLATLFIKNDKLKNNEELLSLIADEVNVKQVVINENLNDEVELDLNLTSELRFEGVARELIRQIQDWRKKAGLSLSDRITINFGINDEGWQIIQAHQDYISQTVGASKINRSERLLDDKIVIDDFTFAIEMLKD